MNSWLNFIVCEWANYSELPCRHRAVVVTLTYKHDLMNM